MIDLHLAQYADDQGHVIELMPSWPEGTPGAVHLALGLRHAESIPESSSVVEVDGHLFLLDKGMLEDAKGRTLVLDKTRGMVFAREQEERGRAEAIDIPD